MWSIEYVQVPIEEKTSKDKTNDNSNTKTKGKDSSTESPLMQRRMSCDSYQQNSAIDRLQDFRDPNFTEISSSVESESNMTRHMESRNKSRPYGIEREESVNSVTSFASENMYNRNRYTDDIQDDVRSVQSADLAVEAYDVMVQSNLSDTQSEPNIPGLVGGVSMDKSQSHPDLKSGELEKTEICRSGSSEFDVISEKEAKNSPKTVDDILRKYRPRTRHTLREGKFY